MPGTKRKAVINSQTSGRFRIKTIGGHEHIVTQMVPIVGDTVMNSIHYPDAEVAASYHQLDNLLAPNGHPQIEGRTVSAFHPLAVNAFNVGGFIKSPVKRGKQVVTEFWLDTEIAGNSDDGIELMRRIKEGEKVGVSTGLNLTLIAQNGTAEDGNEFTAVGKDYKFDHVAILLNEVAAGDHAGTELVTNDGAKLVVGIVTNTTVSDLMDGIEKTLQKQFASGENRVWLRDFIIEESMAIYSVYDEDKGQSIMYKVGIRKVDDNYVVEGMPMPVEEKTSFIPIANSKPITPEPEEDEMEITRENATAHLATLGLVVIDPKSAEAVANAEALSTFAENKDAFTAWQTTQAEALNAKRTECVEATGLTVEQVENMDMDTMTTLITNAKKVVHNGLRGGGVVLTEESKAEAKGTASTFVRGVTAE